MEKIDKKLYEACEIGSTEDVNRLLRKGLFRKAANVNSSIHTVYKRSTFPLHIAAEKGHIEIVKLLLEKNADVNAKEDDGDTPLKYSCLKGYLEIAELLIEKGADVNIRNNRGETPLFGACYQDKKNIVELLIEKGAKVSVKNEDGETPLYCAIENDNKDIVELLLNKGAKINAKDIFEACGSESLHNKDIVELLIEKGAKVNSKGGRYGETPLFNACHEGNKVIIELLIEKGANINIENTFGDRAWYRATEDIKELLIKNGAKEQCIALYVFNSDKIINSVSLNYGCYARGELLKAISKVLEPEGGWIALKSFVQACHGDLFNKSIIGETPGIIVLNNWLKNSKYGLNGKYFDYFGSTMINKDRNFNYTPYVVGIGTVDGSLASSTHNELSIRNIFGYQGLFILDNTATISNVAKELYLVLDMKIKDSICVGWSDSIEAIKEAGLRLK